MESIDEPRPLHHPLAMLGRLLSLPLVVAILALYVLLMDLW